MRGQLAWRRGGRQVSTARGPENMPDKNYTPPTWQANGERAVANARIEYLSVSPEARTLGEAVARGEITLDEAIRRIEVQFGLTGRWTPTSIGTASSTIGTISSATPCSARSKFI